MALEHAILVSLAERAASGYDLARRFDASIGNFWRATHQQVYKVLARMETDALVTSRAVVQDGKPDKKVYAITDAGRAELLIHSRSRIRPEVLRSDFAVTLRGLPFGDRDAILTSVRTRRAEHEQTLKEYRASADRFYPDADAIDADQVGAWLVLRGGIMAETTGLQWCDEILQTLERAPDRDSER